MNAVEAILALLRNVLWGTEVPAGIDSLDSGEWNRVLGIAAAQGIVSLLYDAVAALPESAAVPGDILALWKKHTDANESKFKRISLVAEAQERGWKKKGIPYVMLKGLALAGLYRHPEHRPCGDIDWYFPSPEAWNDACKLAEKVTGGPLRKDSDGDVSYIWNGVVIEHHRGWSHLSSRRAARILGVPASEDGRLSPEEELLMLNGHILHHMSVTGCGLRQFADLAAAYAAHQGKYDPEAFFARMRKLGLGRWIALLHSALVELTGVDAECLPVPPAGRQADVDRIVRLVFTDGNFGLPKERRFSGFATRAFLFVRYCPGEFFARLSSLLLGRLKNGVK